MATLPLPFGASLHTWSYDATTQEVSTHEDGKRKKKSRHKRKSDGRYRRSSSMDLLGQIVDGDELALAALVERFTMPMLRWVQGQLSARQTTVEPFDFDELRSTVRIAMRKTLQRLCERHIVRDATIVLNLRDCVWKCLQSRKIDLEGLEETLGPQQATNYECSLRRLQPIEREALVCVLEFHRTLPQLKDALGLASQDEARIVYARAVVRLAEEMSHGH